MTDGDTDERGMADMPLVTLRVYNVMWWQEVIGDACYQHASALPAGKQIWSPVHAYVL